MEDPLNLIWDILVHQSTTEPDPNVPFIKKTLTLQHGLDALRARQGSREKSCMFSPHTENYVSYLQKPGIVIGKNYDEAVRAYLELLYAGDPCHGGDIEEQFHQNQLYMAANKRTLEKLRSFCPALLQLDPIFEEIRSSATTTTPFLTQLTCGYDQFQTRVDALCVTEDEFHHLTIHLFELKSQLTPLALGCDPMQPSTLWPLSWMPPAGTTEGMAFRQLIPAAIFTDDICERSNISNYTIQGNVIIYDFIRDETFAYSLDLTHAEERDMSIVVVEESHHPQRRKRMSV